MRSQLHCLSGVRLVLTLLLLAAALQACILPQSDRWYRVPVIDTKKDTLFDRYEITLQEARPLWDRSYELNCEIKFIDEVLSGADLREIPVVHIDSFYLFNDCLERYICFASFCDYDLMSRGMGMYRPPHRHPYDFDLVDDGTRLKPEGYRLMTRAAPFHLCEGKELTLMVKAHLYDRTTKQVMDQVQKPVTLQVRRYEKIWY